MSKFILMDDISNYLWPSFGIIIYNEFGVECQRLLFLQRIDVHSFNYENNVTGAYSLENDVLVLKHWFSDYFWVIPSEKKKGFIGTVYG